MSEKPIVWLGSSLANLRAFPGRARQYAGFELGLVQQGLDPTDWRPMPAVGVGVREIRIHTGREHRVLYLAQRADAVFVLHAFEKKSNRTPQSDIKLARCRLRQLHWR